MKVKCLKKLLSVCCVSGQRKHKHGIKQANRGQIVKFSSHKPVSVRDLSKKESTAGEQL